MNEWINAALQQLVFCFTASAAVCSTSGSTPIGGRGQGERVMAWAAVRARGFGCESNWTWLWFGLPLAHCVQWKMETCFPQVAHTHMQSCMPQLVAAGFYCCCGCLKCRVAFCLRARSIPEGGGEVAAGLAWGMETREGEGQREKRGKGVHIAHSHTLCGSIRWKSWFSFPFPIFVFISFQFLRFLFYLLFM